MTVDLRRYLADVEHRWDRVRQGAGAASRTVRIAETDVEVAVGGEELARILLPAFECHPDTTGPAVATVGAWDARATGVALPDRLEDENPLVKQWIVRRDERPVAEVWWNDDDIVGTGNRATNHHLLAVEHSDVLSPWEAGAPLRRQLWWALGPDALFVHAGAVGSEDGVVLIMGASGAGKSTTSVACAQAGMGLLADDYCLVRGDPPVAHLLHATARLHRHELVHFDGLGVPADDMLGRHADDPETKALLFPYRDAPHTLLRSAPVRAVVLTRPVGAAVPRLERVRAAAALRETAPSALWQMHLEADRELAGLRRLLTSVPVYRLELGADRRSNPEVIGQLLDGSAAPT